LPLGGAVVRRLGTAAAGFLRGARRRGALAGSFAAGLALVAPAVLRADSRKWAMMKCPLSTATSAAVLPAAFLASSLAPSLMAALTPGMSLTSTAWNSFRVAPESADSWAVRAVAAAPPTQSR